MDIQDFKRWHWAILGIIAGLVFSYAFSDHDVAGDVSLENREIKQPVFEREALSRSRESHEPILQNIKVEPPVTDFQKHQAQIVRGERLQYSQKYQKEFRVPFYFYAPLPYTPIALPYGTDQATAKGITSVITFLTFAQNTLTAPPAPKEAAPWQQAGLGLHFRYAWEYESKWNPVMWALGGLVVVGGIWPTFLNALVSAGLGRPPKTKSEEDEYLSRFGNGKSEKSKSVVKVVDDAERRKLDELNAAMEGGLKPSGANKGVATVAELDEAVIKSFSSSSEGAPVVAAAQKEEPMSEEERKRQFAAGDFYPVARGPAKKP